MTITRDELAGQPRDERIEALAKICKDDDGVTPVSASLRQLVIQLAREGGWGAWADWLIKRADLLDAVLDADE